MRRAIALLIILATSRAAAEPVNLHMRTPSTCETEGGSHLQLPPGYFMDEPTRDELDRETRHLQDAETRLRAENRSLRGSLASWQPGWIVLVSTAAVALALGIYAGKKI